MAIETVIPELSWLCGLLFLIIVFMLVLTCVCFKDHEKSEYGTAGRLSMTRDSPVLQRHSKNGTISNGSRQSDLNSDEGSSKRNSWTVKDRALPEIPGSTVIPISHHLSIIEDGSTPINERTKVKSHNKSAAPKPPGSDPSKVFPMNGSALMPSTSSGVTVTITVNDKTQIIGNNVKPRTPSVDCVPGTSNSMVVLKKVEKVDVADVSLHVEEKNQETNLYDTVPEVPADRISQSTSMSSSPVLIRIGNPTPSEEGSSSNLSASLAVAGAIPSSDIPYMTPPLLHNVPPPIVTEEEEPRARGEVPYTVISVREPLARVREITLRRQRAIAATQQNSLDIDDHYAMVPEEEQMYAEIGSGHESASSSITYAHIEPRELPPVPPTVESLKSVAHAHSRQASTVSTSSVGSILSGTGDSSPPQLRNTASLYSTVEKNNKQRKTIHLAEGVSVVASTEKRKKVEDLYAKVRKKRVDLTIRTSGCDDYSGYQGCHRDDTDCITPPPSPWASTTPPAPPPITGRLQAASLSVLLPSNSQHVRRHSADPNLPEIINENRVFTGSTRNSAIHCSNDSDEPNYERIYNENEDNSGDSCYERIKDEADLSNKSEIGYERVHHSNGIGLSESNYPGYESVKDLNEDEDSLEPGYERVDRSTTENDPGYEPVRTGFDDSDSNSDYTVVKSDDGRDPGYERVKNLGRSESDAADPGYEKIKKMPRANSDATDPGYERVKNVTDPGYERVKNNTEPGYESVNKSDSDTDPGYEVVHQNRLVNNRYSANNSPVLNSTVVFVSGDSSNSCSHPSPSSEPSATFL